MKPGLSAGAFLLCLGAACGNVDDDSVGRDDDPAGSLVIDWAINGGKSEADCEDVGAVLVRVALESLHRDATTEYIGSCSRASTTLSLHPDDYEGEATLEGRSGTLTRAVLLGTFSISEGAVTSISIDFTADAFQ